MDIKKVFTPDVIQYYKNNKSEITKELLDQLRSNGNEGKQIALDILDTEMSPDNYYLDAFGKKIFFMGDRNLKRAYTSMRLAPIHIEEIKRCSVDLKYFMDNYIKIRTKKGYNFPELRAYQQRFIDVLNSEYESIVAMLGRQAGKSVTVAIYMCWHFNFNHDLNIGICANKGSLAREFLNNVKEMFYSMPMWMRQGVTAWTKGSIESELKMRILTDVPGENAFRGFSISLLCMDETAWLPANKFSATMDSILPSQSAMSWKKNIFISTPNGMNHFHDMVEGSRARKILYGLTKEQIDALNEKILNVKDVSNGLYDVTIDRPSNNMALFEMDWREVPRYNSKGQKIDPDAFKEDIVAKNGLTFFNQNYACLFIGSSYTLISADSLGRLKAKDPEMILANRLRVFEEPKPCHKYIMGVDPAKFGSDSFSIQVLDVTTFPFVQVAAAKLPDENFQKMPQYLYDWGKWYNSAFLIIENNDGAGTYANTVLHTDYEYENLYFEKTFDTYKNHSKTKVEPGFRTNVKNRALILDTLKLLVDNQKLIINDINTIKEFNTFVLKNNKFQADDGFHDDMIMALCIALALFADAKNFENIRELTEKMYSDNTDTDFTEFLCVGGFDDYSDDSGSDYTDITETDEERELSLSEKRDILNEINDRRRSENPRYTIRVR